MADANTGATVAVVSAFDAGNVVSVARALHEAYPDKALVIAGDDDRHHRANRGRAKAEQAVRETGGHAVFPAFAPDERGKDFTDFNDLAVKSVLGQEGVKRQVVPVIERAVKDMQARRAQLQEHKHGQSR